MKDINSLMLEFIAQHDGNPSDKTYPKINQVLDVKIKDYDDGHGAMGEHYVVTCKMLTYTNTGTGTLSDCFKSGTFEYIKSTCLVDVAEFKKFVSKQHSIIWL
jgi:hypothetical protein